MLACAHPVPDRRSKPHPNQILKCPRCDSGDTKFCYYNNYSLTQPRYFCKNCKRYWTDGGALRNVPVGGGLRKNKRSKQKAAAQAEATAAKVPLSSGYDTLVLEKSHVATPTPLSSSDGSPGTPASEDVGNFMRYTNVPPVEQKYSYDRVQRGLYEAGEGEAAELQRLSYAQQFFPGYSYSLVVGGAGAQQGYGGYEMNSRSNASSGVSSEVQQQQQQQQQQEKQRAAMEAARCSNEAEMRRESEQQQHSYTMLELSSSRQQQPLQGQQQDQRLLVHLQELGSSRMDRESGRMMEGNFFPVCTDMKSGSNNDNGGLHDARSDEVSSSAGNVHSNNNNVSNNNNPYDWQQLISEGLFGATAADFFYTPGGSWPDFDAEAG